MQKEKETDKYAKLRQFIDDHKPSIEKTLREHLPVAPPKFESGFNEAVENVLFSEDERLRPILVLLGAELVGGKPESVTPAAAAVEYIHGSARIFNDLPCMDTSPEKRVAGSTVPAEFGEPLAIMVGLGLLNASYPLVFVKHNELPERAMQAHAEIVECVGASGIFSGQNAAAFDRAEDDFGDDSANIAAPSALLRLALRIGAILAGSTYLELAHLSRFSELLGDAHQLAVSSEIEEVPEVSDDSRAETQFISPAKTRLDQVVEEAKRILIENFPSNDARSCLIQLTDYLAETKSKKLTDLERLV